MNKIRLIISIASVLMLLVACNDAKLEELPFLTAEMTVRWADGYPEYEVTVNADDRIEVRNIDILERFLDMNYETGKVDHHRWINHYKPTAPYIFGDKYWPAYGNDIFKSYAKITTSIGLFYSNPIAISYPTDSIVKVNQGLLKIENNDFTLEIPGDNFDMKASYKIGDMDVKKANGSTPRFLVLKGYERERSSKFDTTLSINGTEYPITIDFPVARITSISSTDIEMGDTIYVELTDCGKSYYSFNNCDVIDLDLESQKYTLLPQATKEGRLDITPYYDDELKSYERVKINVKKKEDNQ